MRKRPIGLKIRLRTVAGVLRDFEAKVDIHPTITAERASPVRTDDGKNLTWSELNYNATNSNI